MKRVFKTVLCFLLLPFASACKNNNSYHHSVSIDNPIDISEFSFELLDDDTYSISAKNKDIAGDLVIPETYNGKKVTQIANDAFCGCENIASLHMSKSVKTIGENAFNNAHIASAETIFIHDNVNTIGKNCFSSIKCEGKIVIGKGVKEIPQFAFSNSDFEEIVLGENIETIGDRSFFHTNVSELFIPKKVSSIYNGLFAGQSSKLKNITVDKENAIFKDIDGVLFDKNGDLILYPNRDSKLYEIPDGTTRISEYAFCDYNKVLNKVIIPSSVIDIESFAFYDCDGLNEIVLNEGLTTLNEVIVVDCSSFEKINIPNSVSSVSPLFVRPAPKEIIVANDHPHFVTEDGVLYSKDFKTLVKAFNLKITDKTYQLKEGVERLLSNSFSGLNYNNVQEMETFMACGSLKYVEPYVFRQTLIKTIIFNDNAVFTGDGCLADLNRLVQITLPKNLPSIPNRCFYGCSELKEISIPHSVSSIGRQPIAYTKIENIYYAGTKEEWNTIINDIDITENLSSTSLTIHCTDGDLSLL